MSDNFEAKFIGDKIGKVKFYDTTLGSESFVAGTYDSGCQNSVSLWSVTSNQASGDDEDNEAVQSIVKINSVFQPGDVLGLDNNGPVVACSCSNGGVTLMNIDKMNARLESLHEWSSLHRFYGTDEAAPCTDVSFEDNIATCGEDGSINILDVTRPAPIKHLNSCDSSVLTSIVWITQQCVTVTNSCGQLKVFDIRQSGNQPTQIFSLTNTGDMINCLEKHPSQSHILATGTYSGLIGMFDLRQDSVPVTILEGHNGSPINDLKFHPRQADRLFSCAADGTVWKWNAANVKDGESSWWKFTDAAKHKVEVQELTSNYTQASSMSGFEVNTLAVCNTTCVAGTDNGALCVFYDLDL